MYLKQKMIIYTPIFVVFRWRKPSNTNKTTAPLSIPSAPPSDKACLSESSSDDWTRPKAATRHS